MRNTSYFIEILFTTGLFRMASVELATLIEIVIRNSPVVNKISMK